MLYSVFVGEYKSVPDSKADQKKLNDLGLRGYVFFRGEFYSLKIATYPSFEKAEYLRLQLTKYGFKAYVA